MLRNIQWRNDSCDWMYQVSWTISSSDILAKPKSYVCATLLYFLLRMNSCFLVFLWLYISWSPWVQVMACYVQTCILYIWFQVYHPGLVQWVPSVGHSWLWFYRAWSMVSPLLLIFITYHTLVNRFVVTYIFPLLFVQGWDVLLELFCSVVPSVSHCLHRTGYSIGTCPDSMVHGANMGPTWVLSAPDGPHVGPMNLAIRVLSCLHSLHIPSGYLFL